ncbi:hypothetical protein L2E82_08477 [Cichorium intybus]|uniref:Uncharacterized protein n=1 Tax=Cichorium intybus TaxID=13427 RepID=A0ACB9G755_CICIN|nr:hypothetical protein L2E82_08477 [Cichorium intybus]
MKPGALPLPPSIDWTEHMCALPLPPFFICVCLFPISIVRSEANNAFPFFLDQRKGMSSVCNPLTRFPALNRLSNPMAFLPLRSRYSLSRLPSPPTQPPLVDLRCGPASLSSSPSKPQRYEVGIEKLLLFKQLPI